MESKAIHMFAKPVLVGLTAYVGSTMLNKNVYDDVTLVGTNMNVSFHTYQGLIATGSSLLTTTLEAWVFENFGKNGKMGAQLANIGIATATNLGVSYALYPSLVNEVGIVPLVTNSVVSEGLGAYGYDSFIKPYVDKK